MDEGHLPPALRTHRVVERVADDPLHAVPRVHRGLHGDLVTRALPVEPTDAAVQALRVLPDHHHVHVVLGVGRHQRLHAREPDHRAEVHVLVELEPDPQQQVALEDPGRHARIAHRAQQDRVEAAHRLEVLVGQGLAGAQVAVGAQVEVDELDRDVVADGLEHLERFGDHLGAGAVAPDHADPVGTPAGGERARGAPRSRPPHVTGDLVTAVRRLGDQRRPIDRREVGPRARLHHVGGDAAAGHPPPVDLELHDDVS